MFKEKILIVDDNAANLKVPRFALEGEGYQVWTATNAEGAIDCLYDVHPRLILMDIQLPGMDGLELTRTLRAAPATRDIVIVAVTAYAMMGDRDRALSAGCDGYITKPLDPIRLPVQIAGYLAATGRATRLAPSDNGQDSFLSHIGTFSYSGIGALRDVSSVACSEPDGSKQVVLIIEDNPATCRMYRLSLETAGYDVLEARDGQTALETLNHKIPALIVQDLVLPDMDGIELVRKIREKPSCATLPIICVSGLLQPVDEEQAVRSGFTEVLVKPIDPSQLVAALKTHLAPPLNVFEPVGKGRLIVIADDDPLQRRLAQMWFASAGFKVIAVASGADALETAKREHPAVIVSDVLMPAMDGFALCLALRKDPELAQIPIILTSLAYTEPEDRELAKRVGASALLAKEVGLENVTRVVVATLDELPQASPEEDIPGDVHEEHGRRRAIQLERQLLEKTSLLRRTVLHQAQLAVLAGVADSLARNMLAEAVLGDVLGACLDMAGVSKGALFIRRGEKTLELKNQIGFSESENLRLRGKFGHPNLFAEVVSEGSLIAVPSETVDFATCQHLIVDAGVMSLLLTPVTVGTKTSGVLLLGTCRTDVSDQSTREFAQVLGGLMGHALALTQAFEKLGASELRYRTLTENANDAICILTSEGVVREVNRRLTEMTGFPAEHFIGRCMRDFAVPLHSAENTAVYGSSDGEFAGSARRYQVQKKNGETALIDFSNAYVEIDAESVVFSIGRDVTHQVRAQAQLMVSDRMVSLGMLAAGLAHEVNNPLATLLGNLDLAAESIGQLGSAGVDSRVVSFLQECIKDAAEAGDRIRHIVRDLKIFSRADRAEESFRRPVDLKALLQLTLRMAVNETRHRARVIESYSAIPLVNANESRLGQVFLNLVINAAQAIEDGHADVNEIRISTMLDVSGRVIVEISDTGHGIRPEALQNLFTPFVTTKGADVGTGLGLAICKQIVTELEGEIVVESQVGVGSTFRVFLNQSQAGAVDDAPAQITSSAVRRAQVLVIDDDPTICKMFGLILSRDHEVTTFANARAALQLLESGKRFDVILCDMMMPVITGPEFYSELQMLNPEQARRVVFLTGGVFTTAARDFLESVSNGRLEKPISSSRLREEVSKRVH